MVSGAVGDHTNVKVNLSTFYFFPRVCYLNREFPISPFFGGRKCGSGAVADHIDRVFCREMAAMARASTQCTRQLSVQTSTSVLFRLFDMGASYRIVKNHEK